MVLPSGLIEELRSQSASLVGGCADAMPVKIVNRIAVLMRCVDMGRIWRHEESRCGRMAENVPFGFVGASHLCPMIATRRSIDTMPAHARVWVYKSTTAFTPEQREAILENGAAFVHGWAAHGAALDACVDVSHDRFVVIAVDEEQAMASGCGIDKSVRFVQDLERIMGVQLTDRMVLWYEMEEELHSARVTDLPRLVASGAITADTIVFDDLVATKGDLDEHFRAPLRETWMARYL